MTKHSTTNTPIDGMGTRLSAKITKLNTGEYILDNIIADKTYIITEDKEVLKIELE